MNGLVIPVEFWAKLLMELLKKFGDGVGDGCGILLGRVAVDLLMEVQKDGQKFLKQQVREAFKAQVALLLHRVKLRR